MLKKYLFRGGVGLATVAVVIAGAAAFSAFEAHIVNVTATIENATTMDTSPLTFGDMFPQEIRVLPETISLSSSFLSQNNTLANTVDYVIKQKPKCGLPAVGAATGTPTSYTAFEQVTENANGVFSCPTQGYVMLPLLCPYLSKTSPTPGDTSVPSFHGPTSTPEWTDQVSTQTEAVGHLAKGGVTSTTWQIDLHTPCFAGQCAQDWADFVHTANPAADPAAYMADPANEHQQFGCDLWYEVSGINGTSTGSGTGTLTVTKVVVNTGGGTATTSDFTLMVDGAHVTSGVATTTSSGSHVVSETPDSNYTGAFSGDCDTNGNVTVPANGSANCTLTNTFMQPIGALIVAPSATTCDVTVAPNTATSTIAEGIAEAAAGQTVCVAPGTYAEDVVINKSITLDGTGGASVTTITGQATGQGAAVTIGANNVTLEGFTVNGAGIAALWLDTGVTGANVHDNHFTSASGETALTTQGQQSNDLFNNNEFTGNAASQLAYVNGLASLGVGQESDNVDFTHNTFDGTIAAGGEALGTESTNTDVTQNVFNSSLTSTYAIAETWKANATYHQNNFDGVGGIKVRNSDPAVGTVNAQNNWWGAAAPVGNTSGSVDDSLKAPSAFPEN